ncbi:hypothetical protein KJ972_02010, partial [Candidatus Micrarchaeota archaeon]|nr:hypothetical protein [Candidatus Micrarchaeota archaeon]
VEAATDPRTIMEFLASLTTSVDRKVEENLGKIVDLEKLDAVLKEIPVGKSEEEIATVLREVNTRKVSSVINEITGVPSFQKNVQKELASFCKVYATRKLLKASKAMIDYSEIEIPGMKRVMKAGKKK